MISADFAAPFAASVILFLTAFFWPAMAFFTAPRLAVSWPYSGRDRSASAISSSVFLSSAAMLLAAVPGAARWMSWFICSLLWLYSSLMPIRWPYSWA